MKIEHAISGTATIMGIILTIMLLGTSIAVASEVAGTLDSSGVSSSNPAPTPSNNSSASTGGGGGGGNGAPVGLINGTGGSIIPIFASGNAIIPNGNGHAVQGVSGGGNLPPNLTPVGSNSGGSAAPRATGGTTAARPPVSSSNGTIAQAPTFTATSTDEFTPINLPLDTSALDDQGGDQQYASVMAALGAGDLVTWVWTILALLLLAVGLSYVYNYYSRKDQYERL